MECSSNLFLESNSPKKKKKKKKRPALVAGGVRKLATRGELRRHPQSTGFSQLGVRIPVARMQFMGSWAATRPIGLETHLLSPDSLVRSAFAPKLYRHSGGLRMRRLACVLLNLQAMLTRVPRILFRPKQMILKGGGVPTDSENSTSSQVSRGL